jgi:HK97 family phage major capsid protein
MAVKVNELKQKALEAKKGLNAMQDEHGAARASLASLLEKQAAGTATSEDVAALGEAEAKAKSFEARISAQRKLVTLAEEQALIEEQRLAAEDKELEARPSGRIAVDAPNHTKDPRRGFASHRDLLAAVMDVAQRGIQAADERLRSLIVRDKDDKEAGGEPAVMLPLAFTPPAFRATVGSDEHGEYDVRYGGFGVMTQRLPGILQVGFEGDPTAGRTQAVPMGAPSVEIMARVDKDHTSSVSGGLTVGRKAETVAASATRASLEMITLKASSLFGLTYGTEELLADSPQTFMALVDTGFRTQFPAHMLNEKLRGKGGNEYLGVLTALYSATAANSLGPTISVAKEQGQAADTIDSMNVIKMAARVWGWGDSIWMANHDCKPQMLTMSVKVGTAGQLLYQVGQGGFPDTLLGRPIVYSEFMATVGDQGDIGLFNWSQFLEGLYQPLQSAESIHVRFLNHERAFKFWLRNAGAPWWRSPLTPNKSASTLSPFVVLDARA